MKISSFTEKHNISESTVRYYMKKGLIVPNQQNKQYDFDEECSRDIEIIKLLKELEFSLSEIKRIVLYHAMNEILNAGYNEYFLKLYEDKRKNLLLKREKLDEKIAKVDIKIKETKELQPKSNNTAGIPINFLKFLYCPKCQTPLVIKEGKIENEKINWGILSCSCGLTAKIEDGIIIVGDMDNRSSKPNLKNIKESYSSNSDREFIKLIWASINWCINKCKSIKMSDKIILKHAAGIGVISVKLAAILPEDCYYVTIDEEIEFLRDSKKNLEMNGAKANLIFICTSFTQVPLKNNSVDLHIDKICGPTVNLSEGKYSIEILQDKLKVGSFYLGPYLHLVGNAEPKLIESSLRPYFKLKNIQNTLTKIFTEVDSMDFGSVSMKNEEKEYLLQKGDKIGLWSFFGRKDK